MPEDVTTTAERDVLSVDLAGEALYERLRRFVLSARGHQRLVSTRALAELHGVSVSTARRALEQLAHEGLVYSVQGKGTFVADTGESKRPTTRTILYAEAWDQGPHPYFNRTLHGMLSAAEDDGYRVAVMNWGGEREARDSYLVAEASHEDVCGLIVPWLMPAVYEAIMAANPCVCIMSMIGALAYPNASSVLPDLGLFGASAVQRVLAAGRRRIALVHSLYETLGAALGALSPGRTGAELHAHHIADIARPDLLDPPLTDEPMDALIFDDDRMARAVLGVLAERDPQLHEHTMVVSHANVGEDILPPYVLRAEIDGYEIGVTAMSVLGTMIETGRLKGLSLKVRPQWIVRKERR